MHKYLEYYDLERYIFETVRERFHAEHSIGAFDFFSIVIWKANRAKSIIARKLLDKDPAGRQDLEAIVRELSSSLYDAPDERERMRVLMKEWNFALTMASAILTVCWPETFTVYDYRVCERLMAAGAGDFRQLHNWTNFEKVWEGYAEFKSRLAELAPSGLSLRDQDRYLWGESTYLQLEEDIQRLFKSSAESGPKGSIR